MNKLAEALLKLAKTIVDNEDRIKDEASRISPSVDLSRQSSLQLDLYRARSILREDDGGDNPRRQ